MERSKHANLVKGRFGNISTQSSSGTTASTGLIAYLEAIFPDPEDVVVLSTSDRVGDDGRLLAVGPSTIAYLTFGFIKNQGNQFSISGTILPISSLKSVELTPESTAYGNDGFGDATARIVAKVNIEGLDPLTVGGGEGLLWASPGDADSDARGLSELVARLSR